MDIDIENVKRIKRIWYSMIYRCHSPNVPQDSAIHYRDKGITVCCEWKNSFEDFKNLALCNGYTNVLTIDRINSDGIYCPENCQWITKSENSKKANIEKERRKKEGHPLNGLWMVAERIVLFRYFGKEYCGYKVLETGLYKSEAISKARELNSEKPWNHTYHYSPTTHYRVGDIADSEDIRCFLK